MTEVLDSQRPTPSSKGGQRLFRLQAQTITGGRAENG